MVSLPSRDTDALRSFGAALLGLGTAAAMTFTVFHLLHPALLAMAVGVPIICAVVPGYVIGLIDRRRPAITAALAVVVFSLAFIAVLGGYEPGTEPIYLAAAGALLLALLGAVWGARTRRPCVGAGLLAALYVGAFMVPEALAWRDARRFVDSRLADLGALVGEEVVRVPAGASWHYAPTGGLFPGVELRAHWGSEPSPTASGECDLLIRTYSRKLDADLAATVGEATLNLRPSGPTRTRSQAEAAALLREFGIPTPPQPLEESGALSWRAAWESKAGPNVRVRHELCIRADGSLDAARRIPWRD